MPENIILINISEMFKLLRGQYHVRRVIRSQFDHEPMNLSTEPSVVLRDFIYETPCFQVRRTMCFLASHILRKAF